MVNQNNQTNTSQTG